MQQHGQLGHGLGNLHVGKIALEEDGALRPLRAFVVEGIGGADYAVRAGTGGRRLFLFWHRQRRCC